MTPLQQAVTNNAHWCETICASHGIPGEFHADLWLNRHPVPRFYPNVVTLTPTGDLAQLGAIQELCAVASGPISVKDSFDCLDLVQLGMRSLFSASWLYRAPGLPKPDVPADLLRATRVQTAAELAQWELAWSGEPASSPPAPLFLPALLGDPEIAIFALYHQQRLVAGAIASRTGAIVGVSNMFVLEAEPLHCWAGCIAAIMDCFPGLALVGYEQGNDLAIAQALGFEAVGSLRVWVQ